MRNDARPIGESDRPQSPLASHDPVYDRSRGDPRGSVKHDRQSHIVHPEAKKPTRAHEHLDPTLPTGDSTLDTKL